MSFRSAVENENKLHGQNSEQWFEWIRFEVEEGNTGQFYREVWTALHHILKNQGLIMATSQDLLAKVAELRTEFTDQIVLTFNRLEQKITDLKAAISGSVQSDIDSAVTAIDQLIADEKNTLAGLPDDVLRKTVATTTVDDSGVNS